MRRLVWWCALAAVVLGPVGEARAEESYRIHPEYKQRMAAVRSIVIVVPDLKAYELMRNDQPIFQAEWTDRSRENVFAALERQLKERGLPTRRLEVTPEVDVALQDVAPMYRAALTAILQATYLNGFQAQKDRFDYTLGDLSGLAPDADAFVLVWGRGVTSSGGRRAFQLFFGNGAFGVDRLMVAVVARSGELLWFDPIASTQFDLRDPASAESFVATALSNLPKVAR
jgi:hypothetical protein